MNTLVNIETAKLLKEKEFNLPTRSYRQKSAVIDSEKILPLVSVEEPYDWNNYSLEVPYYSMPTIAEVVMWLYEKHGIWVEAGYGFQPQGFYWLITMFKDKKSFHSETNAFQLSFNSPTEAYEAAITYTLEKIIKGGKK